ncbi:hypothetical protein X880_6060 [Burkholderia pseudomallei MSHR4032]|uniref:hypothetical protein n=2 Tax=Burkholderia pseudomallei TaxID=28450 RepID=UPI000055AAA1|nr:hypothetical protein [Burkholderia pseudomallei]KGS43909.1 hypothetical protein X945_3218 [Burkholderia pseudomallei ABCPW 107]ABN85816.1 conserved hypothetical protein [Burkholderia pseudomallei 668]AGZ30422.1 hypothetical protein BBK_4366 [Burkholderia pseudomallei NCTC 13179]AJX90341.1 hypothetical protein BH02_3791 [Burkholderia pseudomallei]KGU91255.1 hypothetical protein X880_6060 [Burkholderia pseudomallei MSHR4032]
MTVDSPIFRMLREIRDADMTPIDRELLRPAFAALDGGPVIPLPDRVIARVRDIHARMPKSR